MKISIFFITSLILFYFFSYSISKAEPCSSCHPTLGKGYVISSYESVGNIYATIGFACPDYVKVLKEKYYTEELIMKSEELIEKLRNRGFYTLPLEKALPAIVQKYLEINTAKVISSEEYSKKNLKVRFELNKTYSKLADYDYGFKGRNTFTITFLTLIFLFVSLITGWKKAHNKKIKEIEKYLDEQDEIHKEKSEN